MHHNTAYQKVPWLSKTCSVGNIMPILQEATNNMGRTKYSVKLDLDAIIRHSVKSLNRIYAENTQDAKYAKLEKFIHFPRSGYIWRGPLQGNKAVIWQVAQVSAVAGRSRCHNVDEPC